MKALLFSVSIPRIILNKALQRYTDSVVFGSFSGLSLRDVAVPRLPGPDWVQLDVLICGICGTDTASLVYKTSPALEPFVSLPAVFGHEILARVRAVGPDVTNVKIGDRVVIDPTISCRVRGRSANDYCPSCADGLPATCAHGGEASGPSPNGTPLARGLLLGANSDLPGGFSEHIVAHESQLFPVDDLIDDTLAVLTEPLSIAVHAVLQSAPEPQRDALVIGSGPIAFSTIWALRALGHRGTIIAQTKRPAEALLARELGATETVTPGDGARAALLRTGAAAYKPIIGAEVFSGGGFPLVFDCVGRRQSLDQALRFVAPRGKIILLGCAGALSKLDLSFLWAREVQISGFVGYGREHWRGRQCHTFEVTHQLLKEADPIPLRKLVSHSFPLSRYKEALSAAMHRKVSGAIKVVLTPK
ncbi:MAG: alcohol dehydrogenase catalytic domain-containing protein [Alphaproteobacteria bacterium]|nr:alcohol dehydrogenase catalytic domain-containing protein [Alphaproteobacteria bacterium]